MPKNHLKQRLVILVALLLVIELGRGVEVNGVASVAIILYDHGFVKQRTWIRNNFITVNRTNSFTQDDRVIIAFFTAALSSANVTWQWFEPDGALFEETNQTVMCAVSPCTFTYWFGVSYRRAGTLFGNWTMKLQTGGSTLYADHFTIEPVTIQYNQWHFTILSSLPPRIHGDLTVTLHPTNVTWSRYTIYIPNAANFTAHDLVTNHTLAVTNSTALRWNTLVTVDFGTARSDGYTFVLSFDLKNALQRLAGYPSSNFILTWRDAGWMRFGDRHPIPETFVISLPQNASLVDLNAFDRMALNYSLTDTRPVSITFGTTFLWPRNFGWTVIYRDFNWQSSTVETTAITLPLSSEQTLPVLHLTLGDLSLWSAIMSVFLLTGSELISPIYTRSNLLINRRRLRIVALILVILFLVTTAYRLGLVAHP